MDNFTPHDFDSTRLRKDRVNRNLILYSFKDGLVFGTDAWLLASFVRGKCGKAAELGCGTGIVTLLLKDMKKTGCAYGMEIQPDYAELSAFNAEVNRMDGVRFLCRDVREATPADTDGECDLVVANPPYMKTDSGKQNESPSKMLARHEHSGDIGDFCRAAARLLRFGGKFVSVYRPDRLCDLIAALRESKLEPKRMTFVHSDAEAEPCMVLCESVLGGHASLTVTKPLFLYEPSDGTGGKRTLTPEARRIYDEGQWF